ncbi:MAG: hypothetical protein H6722_16325 [Sandaracinus sp.]|nr:hypothetical protein [Myxococcales bacterium]MCB9603384.1 hypothetical protein [Sandaracinus sp.]MCB9614007.1 hypothetical protein [Sandaracinus sp.]MCB9624328.1 hypothetical protein [Sandaracinus sp.]
MLVDMVGGDVVERALSRLPATERDVYENATPVSWIDCDVIEHVYEAIAREAGQDVARLQEEVMRRGVNRTVHSLWRILLRFTSDNALVTRTPLFYRKVFDKGEMVSRVVDRGRAEIELKGFPEISDFHLRGLLVGIGCVIEAAGRRNVQMTPRRTREGAFVIATWTW